MSLSTNDDLIQQQFAAVPDQQSLVGQFVSATGALASVIVGGQLLTVRSASQQVVPGDSVRLERRNGSLIMTGPTRPRSRTGRVTATGALTTVEYPDGSGITDDMRRNNAYTPAINDLVLIDWGVDGGVIVGKIDAAPSTTAPPTPEPGGAATFDITFSALDSGAYQSPYGWRTNDVWGSASNSGGWFYGSKIRDTIPDTATIGYAAICLPLLSRLGVAMFGRHSSDSKPGGALTFAATTDLAGTGLNGWVPIPTSLIDHLKANPGGLGFDFGGKNIWRGTQSAGQSGALRVIYTA